MYELHVAGLVARVGKICIPEYVMDKATNQKPSTIGFTRWNIDLNWPKRKLRYRCFELCANGRDEAEARAEFNHVCTELESELAFIRQANIGGEFMHDY